MTTLPDDERLRELADTCDDAASQIRFGRRCDLSVAFLEEAAAAYRAVIAIREAVSEVTDGRHLSDAIDEIEAILADAPARARRG